MGPAGMEKIFADSVSLHQKEIKKSSSMVLSDTTVQGNNVTFPTDAQRNQKGHRLMQQNSKKRKDPTETDRCQSLERTGASNLQ
ncbi:MAG: hypothetical protein OXE55_06855 [Flavobacteriaceae bacterium]|nr:hypothetical protein [Flavobacteriaceae bacterium]